jgi:transcriptional regulator with XRE-family HTH domain
MSDKDIEKALNNLFSSDHSPPITDAVVDAFLASSAEAPVESGERVMALFVQKVLANLHAEPIKEVEEESFGRWIQTIRQRARLALSDIGIAIGKEPAYIERLESGTAWPWDLDPKDMVNILCLFRIHINTTLYLVQKSFVLSRAHVSGDVIGRAHKGKMTKERGESTKRALDMFLARNAKPEKLDDSILEWLSNVRKHLEDYQAKDLLD